MRDMPQSTSPVRKGTVYALICAALAVVAPFAVRGIACGHDLTFHMNSWMEAAQQWRQGVIYPRWAAMANYGGGEPRFLFYPPLSWMLGGALGSLMPWMFAPVAFDCCVVILAGLAMFRMASEWFDASEATLIARGLRGESLHAADDLRSQRVWGTAGGVVSASSAAVDCA